MIASDTIVFPNNAVDLLALRIPQFVDPVPADMLVFKRPLRSSDPRQCCAVWPAIWRDVPETAEMLGKPNFGNTLNRYTVVIQGLVIDMEEEKGIARHSVLSSKLRTMLYRDNVLRLGLTALSVSESGGTERLKKWEVGTQRYIANEVEGSFMYLTNLELFLETESM